jgi:hypothetical protein
LLAHACLALRLCWCSIKAALDIPVVSNGNVRCEEDVLANLWGTSVCVDQLETDRRVQCPWQDGEVVVGTGAAALPKATKVKVKGQAGVRSAMCKVSVHRIVPLHQNLV